MNSNTQTHRRPTTFIKIKTQPTSWDPRSVNVTMNVRLDGAIVPSAGLSSSMGARVSYSHVVVLDDFVDDVSRKQLLSFLTSPDDDLESKRKEENYQSPKTNASITSYPLPGRVWERQTMDYPGAAPSWGVKQHVLQELAHGRPEAIVEIQSRLQLLYPEYDVVYMPSDAIQHRALDSYECNDDDDDDDLKRGAKRPCLDATTHDPVDDSINTSSIADTKIPLLTVDCCPILVNAAVHSDTFKYHVDADPSNFPAGTAWHALFGDYFNGEPGKPLFVSLLIYLNADEDGIGMAAGNERPTDNDAFGVEGSNCWHRDWAADTLFLDSSTDTGVFVRPRAGRAVLMDQDVLHRVSPPSALAGGRPRLSLVLKLVFLPKKKDDGAVMCIAKKEWGVPSSIGSAARVEAVKRKIYMEERAKK